MKSKLENDSIRFVWSVLNTIAPIDICVFDSAGKIIIKV